MGIFVCTWIMKANNKKKANWKAKPKKLSFAYYDAFLKKECPCTKNHKTSTPVRVEFDIYEDIIFVPAKDLTSSKFHEAFLLDSSRKNKKLHPVMKRFKKIRIGSKNKIIKVLTIILCNIL